MADSDAGFAPAQRVKLGGLTARAELNGTEASIVRWDAKLSRWRVRTDEGSCLALKAINLWPPDDSDADFEELPAPSQGSSEPSHSSTFQAGDLVTVQGRGNKTVRLVLAVSACGTKLDVRPAATPSAKPTRVEASAAAPLPNAPENVIPTEFLYCRVKAKEAHSSAKAAADVTDVRIDPLGKLRFQVRWVESEEVGWVNLDEMAADEEEEVAEMAASKGKRKAAAAGEGSKANGAAAAAEGKPAKRRGKEKAVAEEAPSKVAKKPKLPPADAWEAALDALQPDSEEEEEEEKGKKKKTARPSSSGGGAASSGEAGVSSSGAASSSAAAAPAAAPGVRNPALAGFRIGGQAETAEERGEGW